MKRNYPGMGARYNDTPARRKQVNQAIAEVQWMHEADIDKNIKDYRRSGLKSFVWTWGAHVDRVGYCTTLFGKYTLLALQNNYTKGELWRVRVYGVNIGDYFMILAIDSETKQEVELFKRRSTSLRSRTTGLIKRLKRDITKKLSNHKTSTNEQAS